MKSAFQTVSQKSPQKKGQDADGMKRRTGKGDPGPQVLYKTVFHKSFLFLSGQQAPPALGGELLTYATALVKDDEVKRPQGVKSPLPCFICGDGAGRQGS